MNRILGRAVLLGTVALTVVGRAAPRSGRPSEGCRAMRSPSPSSSEGNWKDIVDDPEFYMRGTVVDVGYGAAQDGLFTSTYAQPDLPDQVGDHRAPAQRAARLRAHRGDSTARATAINGLAKKTTNDGQIVASYAIESHFDIRPRLQPVDRRGVRTSSSRTRAIGPGTSASTSASTGRATWPPTPTTSTPCRRLGLYGGVEYEPLAYYGARSRQSADAPQFDAENGYFDVTDEGVRHARPCIDLSSLGWGIDKYPGLHAPGRLRRRHASRTATATRSRSRSGSRSSKVVDSDYEPVDVDGVPLPGVRHLHRRFPLRLRAQLRHRGQPVAALRGPLQHLGAQPLLREPRDDGGRDRLRHLGDDRVPTAIRRPIPTATTATARTAPPDACAPRPARARSATCSSRSARCPTRSARPVVIPWYIGGNTSRGHLRGDRVGHRGVGSRDEDRDPDVAPGRVPEDRRRRTATAKFPMWKGQQDDIDEAVALARDSNACRREQRLGRAGVRRARSAAGRASSSSAATAATRATLAHRSVVTQPSVIVLCHNPVVEGDHPACGDTSVPLEERVAPRLGDLRYNSVLIVEKPQTPSPWGIMVDADDPLTRREGGRQHQHLEPRHRLRGAAARRHRPLHQRRAPDRRDHRRQVHPRLGAGEPHVRRRPGRPR